MKIIIADDHTIVREGLRQILRDLYPECVIEESCEGNDALKKIRSGNFDFVILDISMPGLSGIDILKALKDQDVKGNVLMLSVYPQKQYAIRSLRLGASGYLTKDCAREELALAIKKISSGGKYISSEIIGDLVSGMDSPEGAFPHDRLSEREFQIMCLLARGQSNIEIGKQLYISEKTVSTYRSRLLEKMNMKGVTELALYAFKNNLIE
jgi:DNA-binding NarL/FixJ family response regulator